MLKGHSLGSAHETLSRNHKEDHCTYGWIWDVFGNNPCGEPCEDYATLEISPSGQSAYSVYLDQNDINTFNLSNPSFNWNYPLNTCTLSTTGNLGSSNKLMMQYSDNEFDEDAYFKVEILSVFESGSRNYNEAYYYYDSWVDIDKYYNQISIDMCTPHFYFDFVYCIL